jgi:proline iminopeptidase
MLITVGRYGMAPPRCTETIGDRIPGAEVVVFEHSGHYPMLEEAERFLRVVGWFLDARA